MSSHIDKPNGWIAFFAHTLYYTIMDCFNKEAVKIWHEIMIATKTREQFLDITTLINAELERARIKDGVCYVYIPHTTAGVTINENADPDVTRDILKSLARLIPERGDYAHAEGNSDAHLKASMMGFSCMIPVSGGRLVLGTWQGVYFCEFDGPRKRKFMVGLLSGTGII